MLHRIRLATEPTAHPTNVWVRLAVDRMGCGEQLDAVRLNHTAPVPITLPEPHDVAVRGQPAQGWITKLDVRQAPTGDGLELWGLVHWLGDAEAPPPTGNTWALVTIEDNAMDAPSDQRRGPRLRSVELTDPPTPTTFTRATARTAKDTTMNTTDTLLAALPRYRPQAPNDTIALERAATDLVAGAKTMTREQLYEHHVHPAMVALGKQRLRAAGRAGHLRQALPSVSTFGRPAPAAKPDSANLPVLDVTAQATGRNATEKLILHVKASRPELSHDAAFLEAMRLKQTHRVIA